MRGRWTWILVLLPMTGCTMGPDYVRPQTAADAATAFANASADRLPPDDVVAPAAEPGVVAWWRGFGDPLTDRWVEQALAANTDMRAAAARVLEARAGLRQARSTRLPEIGASLDTSRQKSSFVLPTGRVSPIATTYGVGLDVAYQADLFGGLRRGRQQALADVLARQAARDAITHTVIAEVVRGRVRLSTLNHRLTVARGTRDSWQGTLRTTERRYESGLASVLDVRLARENLASAEAAVVVLEGQRRQARVAVDVLRGQRPGASEPVDATLPALPDLAPVPLGLPVDLLSRRPDVREAELRLAGATAGIGIALADLFPGLRLTGSAGSSADTLGTLLSSDTIVYGMVASLVASVFDGGRRRAVVAGARARADEAAARYAGAVLTALAEVEDALVREATLAAQVVLLDRRLAEARAADRVARERYARGVESLLRVLESERRLRVAEEQRLDAYGQIWDARIDLHLALGGDWHAHDDMSEVEDS